jgi:sialic acid synthase SpsE
MRLITLGSRTVGERSQPYIIAEIGVNHGGAMETALRLIALAKEGGAHAAKFQTYKAERLASRHSPAYWDVTKEAMTSQYLLFKQYDAFGPREYERLAAYCREIDIDFLSTPFDDDAVDVLDPLMAFFKVASADVTNLPLLRRVGRKEKPVVLSTGASTLGEVDIALDTLTTAGCPAVALMHCVLNYPTDQAAAHLGMIEGLRQSYPDLVIGYSDHTVPDEPMTALTTAFLLGAVIIEKHFTHDKTLPGNDHYHAMDVEDLKRLVARLRDIQTLVGTDFDKHPLESEAPARQHARRSVVLQRAVGAGQMLGPDDLTCKRPGTGISALHWDEIVGKRARRDLEADTVLAWTDLEG